MAIHCRVTATVGLKAASLDLKIAEVTAHTAFDSRQAQDQPIRAVKTANKGNSIVQAAAILPVVTGTAVPSPDYARRGAAGIVRAGLLEDELCLDGND